jgi:hypothetical protein
MNGFGATVTTVFPVMPADRAEIVAVPGPTPVACPWLPNALLTVATPGVSDAQMDAVVRSWIEPSLKFP